MVRQVQVTVPLEQADSVHRLLVSNPDTFSILRLQSSDPDNQTLISFKCKDKKLQGVLDLLEDINVGIEPSTSVDVFKLQMTKPRIDSSRSYYGPNLPKQYRVDDRMAVEEIYDTIDSGIHLTFDFIAFTVIAAVIAAVGLLSNSSVSVVASMLVSPLMGPILGLTFGLLLGDKTMKWKSFRTELVGLSITFGVGLVAAIFATIFMDTLPVTEEMRSRGLPSGLVWGIAIALPSGAGVALSLANGSVNSLVGVAISASLLPPITNAGLNVGIAAVAAASPGKSPIDSKTHLVWAIYSFLLFIVNWICITVAGMAAFRLKKVSTKKPHQESRELVDVVKA